MIARIDPDAPKHRGISLFLLGMKTPGVSVRPVYNMAGSDEFNEVFFDNVRVPKQNLVGEENRGWYTLAVALDFERSGVGYSTSGYVSDMAKESEASMGTEKSETPYGLDPESIERDCVIQFLRGSGPGGQNRNKVETGVRLTHRPTGISVTATDTKSQSQNRENALDRLRKKLIEMNTPEVPRIATKTPRRVKKQRVEQKRTLGKKKESRQNISPD